MDLPIPYEVNREKNYDGDGDGDGDGNENVKKATGLMSKTTTLHVHFFTVPAQLRREIK